MKASILAALATAAGLATGAGAQDAANMIRTDGIGIRDTTVVFPMVKAAQGGYIVIHATDENGNMVAPASIAHTAISQGENKEVVVDMGEEFKDSTRYIAMLHAETNGNDTYDFAEGSTDVDTPVTEGGQAVTVPFDSGDM